MVEELKIKATNLNSQSEKIQKRVVTDSNVKACNTVRDPNIQTFQFPLFHRTISCNICLYKLTIKSTNKCNFCTICYYVIYKDSDSNKGLNSFRYKGPNIWNSLPNYIKEAISLSEFKFLIKSWDGPKCLCNLCQAMAGNQCGLRIKMSQLPFFHIL